MQIAELFVNLGIKGSEKTVSALSDTKKGISDIASTSLEAKAALLGVMYGLEQLFSKSSQAGIGLKNFGSLLGGGTKELQQYQYVARQIGSSNEEMASTFVNLSSAATKVRMGGNLPAGFARISQLTGLTVDQYKKGEEHPEVIFNLLQKYSQLQKDKGFMRQDLRSMGISDTLIAGMTQNAFNPKALAAAPVRSDKMVGALANSYSEWQKTGDAVDKMLDSLNAEHGAEMAKNIKKLIGPLTELINAFDKLSKSIHLFEAIDTVFKGWAELFGFIAKAVNAIDWDKIGVIIGDVEEKAAPVIGAVENAVSTFFPKKENEEESVDDSSMAVKAYSKYVLPMLDKITKNEPAPAKNSSKTKQQQKPIITKPIAPIVPGSPVMIKGGFAPATSLAPKGNLAPIIPIGNLPSAQKAAVNPPLPAQVSAPQSKPDVTVNQTNNFTHPGVDPVKTQNSVMKASKDAYLQSPALLQGS